MKSRFYILFFPFDVTLTGGVAAAASVVAFGARFRKEKNKKAVFLVPGADITSIHRKFGTLNIYLQDDPDFFDQVFRFLWGKTNCRIGLRDNFTVIERRVEFPFPLFGLARLFFSMALTVFSEKISLIHARDPYLCGFLAYILARVTDRSFCVSIHSDYDKRFELDPLHGAPTLLGSRRLAKRLEKFVLHKADLVMPIREHLAEQVVCLGVPPERVKVIPHGIDLTPFEGEMPDGEKDECRRRFLVPQGKHIVSFVGRISRENYVYDIIEMVWLLRNKREDFVLIMAGGGNEERMLKKLIDSDEELKAHVRLPGFISHEDSIKLRRISDVNLVLMGGFSLIEACASGKPVVAYDVEWHSELVKHGETGYLVPEGDIEGLVSAVDDLLSNPEKGRVMGQRTRDLVFKYHSVDATAAVKRECYRKLLGIRLKKEQRNNEL